MIERIEHNGELLAIIIPHDFSQSGIHFFTPDHFSQQVAFMKHPKGKEIQPHVHNQVLRQVHYTQEVLLIRSGKLRVDFYTNDKEYLNSRILCGGDVILLAAGGHGFECLGPVEIIEIKQGPYAGEQDKIRFSGIHSSEAKIHEHGI